MKVFSKLKINGQEFEWPKQFITGAELKILGSVNPSSELYLAIKDPWDDELVNDHDEVDLARPGVEYFFTKIALQLIINDESFLWHKQFISGAELRRLANIDAVAEIYLQNKKPFEDQLIPDSKTIDVARPGTEHFYSKSEPECLVIIVNGRERSWDHRKISYAQAVKLAFDNYSENASTFYTVTYKRGPEINREGTIVKGDTVVVKSKMIFNVTPTDKS